MKIRLGYACNCLTINETASHTITYTNFNKLNENGIKKLDEVIKSNFMSLENILKFNIENNILFYRMTAEFLPLSTHPDVSYYQK